tara:strand:+ start:1812 stop:2039 length:228 start_codon:yes stop_codon:yes gene_type:complete
MARCHIQKTNNNNMNNENKLSTVTALRAYNALRVSADKILAAIATVDADDRELRNTLTITYNHTQLAINELEDYI